MKKFAAAAALSVGLTLLAGSVTTPASAAGAASPAGAEVYIIAPAAGAKVSNPVTVRFGLKGMGVAPAGVQFDNSGHHHLFIDTALPTDMTQPIPVVEGKVVHFGKGQTETTLTLTPGKHTLQLVLGDATHTPHTPPVISKQITITVVK